MRRKLTSRKGFFHFVLDRKSQRILNQARYDIDFFGIADQVRNDKDLMNSKEENGMKIIRFWNTLAVMKTVLAAGVLTISSGASVF